MNEHVRANSLITGIWDAAIVADLVLDRVVHFK
jgi:hypothetical protein